MKLKIQGNEILLPMKSDLFSNSYDFVTIFVTNIPLGLFVARLLYKMAIKINVQVFSVQYSTINMVVIGFFLVAIISVYLMHKDERYNLYIGDTKCQVGEVLMALLFGYFMPKTTSFNDIVVNFTLIITSLFFICDGMSDMSTICESIKEKKIFNNSKINGEKRIEIIKILNSIRFILIMIFVVVNSCMIILISESLNTLEKISIDELLFMDELSIAIIAVTIPIMLISSKLLKIVYYLSKQNLIDSKKERIGKYIYNTIKSSFNSKQAHAIFIVYYLIIVGGYLLCSRIMLIKIYYLALLAVVPPLISFVLLKIIENRLNKIK